MGMLILPVQNLQRALHRIWTATSVTSPSLLGVPALQLSAVIFNVFFDKALASDGKWLQHNLVKKWAELTAFLYGRKSQPQPECKAPYTSFFHCFTTNFYQKKVNMSIPSPFKAVICLHTFHTSSLVALRVGETDGGCSELHQNKVFSAAELYQDTFPPLLLKKFFEVTAKQSWSNASATRLREEPGCQKSWMWGSDSSPNAVMKGALHTKAARTIKNLLACPLCSFTSFIIPTDSLLQN